MWEAVHVQGTRVSQKDFFKHPRLTPTPKAAAQACSRQPAFWITVWQWSGASSPSWCLALPVIQSYCFRSCTHLMDPLHRHRLCMVVPQLCQKFSHVSSGLSLAGLHISDAEDSTSVVSDPSGADLSYGSALEGLWHVGALGLLKGRQEVKCRVETLRCLNIFVDYTLVILSRILQKHPCLCPSAGCSIDSLCAWGIRKA